MLILTLVLFILFLVGCLVVVGWYAHQTAKKITFADENMTYLFSMFDAYKTHLKSLYELEEFHGEGSIKGAILHTDTILQLIDVIVENNNLTEYNIYEVLQEIEMEEENEDLSTPEKGENDS